MLHGDPEVRVVAKSVLVGICKYYDRDTYRKEEFPLWEGMRDYGSLLKVARKRRAFPDA